MSSRNGMDGLICHKLLPTFMDWTFAEFGTRIKTEPDEENDEAPRKKQKIEITAEDMQRRMMLYFSYSKNKVDADADEWYMWFHFCQDVLGMKQGYAHQTWKKRLPRLHADTIKQVARYVKVGASDGKLFETAGTGLTPVMTISGMRRVLHLMPKNSANELAAAWLEDFIEKAGAKAVSSANNASASTVTLGHEIRI